MDSIIVLPGIGKVAAVIEIVMPIEPLMIKSMPVYNNTPLEWKGELTAPVSTQRAIFSLWVNLRYTKSCKMIKRLIKLA